MNSKSRKFFVQLKVGGLVSVYATHFRYDEDLGRSITFFIDYTLICGFYASDVAYISEIVDDPFKPEVVLSF